MDAAAWARETLGKWRRVAQQARRRFVERDGIIDHFQLCIIAGEHLLLNGHPGTAKTDLTKFLLNRVDVRNGHPGGSKRNYFEYLMNTTTDPAALVGPYSVKGMEEDRFYRVWKGKGYMPDCLFSYLDEADKSNDAALNYVLPITNERVMHNDGDVESVNTHMVVFSANEPFPEKTYALVDRIMVQMRVNKIKSRDNFVLAARQYERYLNPLTRPLADEHITFAAEEILNLHTYAMGVDFPEPMMTTLSQIWERMDRDGFVISDRRFFKSIKLLKAAAVLRGGSRVSKRDFAYLKWALATGNYEDQADDVQKIIDEYCTVKADSEAKALLTQAHTLIEQLMQLPDGTPAEQNAKKVRAQDVRKAISDLVTEANKKMERVEKDGDDTDYVTSVRDSLLLQEGVATELYATLMKLPHLKASGPLNVDDTW